MLVKNKNNFLKMEKRAVFFVALYFLIAFVFSVPSRALAAGIVPCGGPNEEMCTLCDLIVGIHNIIDWGLEVAFFIGVAAFAIAGVMYIISSGGSMIDNAKAAMKNAVIGIVVMFSAWLIVNYSMHLLGTKEGLGISATTTWNNFTCAGKTVNSGSVSTAPATNDVSTASSSGGSTSGSTKSATNYNAKLGESCGENNSGICVNTIFGACPGTQTHVWGGKSCVWGTGCCKEIVKK